MPLDFEAKTSSSFRGSFWNTCLVALAFEHASALDIYRVSDPIPVTQDRESKNVCVSGDGLSFAYESDTDYLNTGLALYADGVWNIWKTDMSSVFNGSGVPKVHTLVSSQGKRSDKDAKWVSLDYTGKRACFSSNVPGEESIMLSEIDEETGSQTITYITNLNATSSRDAWYCDISSDGKTIVFDSDAELIPGIQVPLNYNQIYMTKDDGQTITMVTPPELVTEKERSAGAVVSGDGSFVAFRSQMQYPYSPSESSDRPEAWMYRVIDEKLERITNFKNQECNTDLIYNYMIEKWGQENLTKEEVFSVSYSSCPYAAVQGWIPASGTIGIGYPNQPKMSDNGRFVTFTTNFNPANMHGTKDNLPKVVSTTNLFLYDSVLGFTWKITEEGIPGFALDFDIEEFCCPGAYENKQRGHCALSDEMKGFCCWQNPCYFPALNSDISGNGDSITFVGDLNHDGKSSAINKDLEIWHYHIPTSTFTPVTQTDDPELDDLFPSVSYHGDVVAFTSDFDYSTGTPIIATNQVFAAKIAMGCSRDINASNYILKPDIETCCEYTDSIFSKPMGGIRATLFFEGDLSNMVSRVPFTSQSYDDRNAFCKQYLEDVRRDLACSLVIPLDYVRILNPSSDKPCGNMAENGISVTVEIDASTINQPSHLQFILEDQYNDPKSFLWRAYITKTLSEIKPPIVSTFMPSPTSTPTEVPSVLPTTTSSPSTTYLPTTSSLPTTGEPTNTLTNQPTGHPTSQPTHQVTSNPSRQSFAERTSQPTRTPFRDITKEPTRQPISVFSPGSSKDNSSSLVISPGEQSLNSDVSGISIYSIVGVSFGVFVSVFIVGVFLVFIFMRRVTTREWESRKDESVEPASMII